VSSDLIKFAYVAGEIAPTFFGRSDLEKFDLAMSLVDNWFVDYRGGLVSRPGTYMREYIYRDDLPTKEVEFKFNSDIANVYLLLFGHQYIRFVQDGGYLLEAGKAIVSLTLANPGVIEVTAHGFASTNWVKVTGVPELVGRTLQITVTDANHFSIQDPFGVNIDTTAFAAFVSGTVFRVYTIASPYDADDLENLTTQQRGDTLVLTHINYRARELVRHDHTDWVLAETVFGNKLIPPTNLKASASSSGAAGVAWGVTSVDKEGNESVISTIAINRSIVDYATTAGSFSMKWDVAPNAISYNVYRSIILSAGQEITRGQELGFLGATKSPVFTDNNIIPDFTRTPPLHNDPFVDGGIESVVMTNEGSGYDDTSTVSITDPTGTGFAGYVTVATAASSHGSTGAAGSGNGEILSVVVTQPGKNYTAPVVVFTGAGTLAAATATVGELTGNNPSGSVIFQQRQVYAATDNKPLTIFASKPRRFTNFDNSDVVLENDSYEFDIDSEEVTPIRHIVPVKGGMLIMTQSDIFMLNGGANGAAVTPTNAQADPQSYNGASKTRPIKIDTELLYVEANSFVVRLLSYNEFSKIYKGEDVSILSNHFFGVGKQIKTWAYASAPHKYILCVREDGTLLCFTVVSEQKVFGWTQWHTRGFVEDGVSIIENGVDTVYQTTRRLINGRWTKFLEQYASRLVTANEDAFCLDCGLSTVPTYPAFSVQASATSGTVTFVSTGGDFISGDVGKVIRVGGGKATITSVVGGDAVGTLTRPITVVNPGTSTPALAAPGEWTLDTPFNIVYGLHHLVGETVTALIDGNVVINLVVAANGSVALGRYGTRVHIGLPYECIARTLPPIAPGATLEGRRKTIPCLKASYYESRGLRFGPDLDHLYDLKERMNEDWNEPTLSQTGTKEILIPRRYDETGFTYFVQSNPLPATILGHVIGIEVGDDND
jgi:hypothetical protein